MPLILKPSGSSDLHSSSGSTEHLEVLKIPENYAINDSVLNFENHNKIIDGDGTRRFETIDGNYPSTPSSLSSISDIDEYHQPPYYGADLYVNSFVLEHLTNDRVCNQGVLRTGAPVKSLKLDERELRDIVWEIAMNSWKLESVRAGGEMLLFECKERGRGQRNSLDLDEYHGKHFSTLQGWKSHSAENEVVVLLEVSKGYPPVCAIWEDFFRKDCLNQTRWKSLGRGESDSYQYLLQKSEDSLSDGKGGKFTKVRSISRVFEARSCAAKLVTVLRPECLDTIINDEYQEDENYHMGWDSMYQHTSNFGPKDVRTHATPDQSSLFPEDDHGDIEAWYLQIINRRDQGSFGGDGTADKADVAIAADVRSSNSDNKTSAVDEDSSQWPEWMQYAMNLTEADIQKLPVFERSDGKGLRVIYITKDPETGDRVPLVDYVGEMDQRYDAVYEHIQKGLANGTGDDGLTIDSPQLGIQELRMRLDVAYENIEKKRMQMVRQGRYEDDTTNLTRRPKRKDLSSNIRTMVIGPKGRVSVDGFNETDEEGSDTSTDSIKNCSFKGLMDKYGQRSSGSSPGISTSQKSGTGISGSCNIRPPPHNRPAFGDIDTDHKHLIQNTDIFYLEDSRYESENHIENLVPQISQPSIQTEKLSSSSTVPTQQAFSKFEKRVLSVQGHFVMVWVVDPVVFLQIDNTILSYPPNTPPHAYNSNPLLEPLPGPDGLLPLLFRVLPSDPMLSRVLSTAFVSVFKPNPLTQSQSETFPNLTNTIRMDSGAPNASSVGIFQPRPKPWLDKLFQRLPPAKPLPTKPYPYASLHTPEDIFTAKNFRYNRQNPKFYTNAPTHMPKCLPQKIAAFPGYMYDIQDYEKYGQYGVPGAYEISDHTKVENKEDVRQRLRKMAQWEKGLTFTSSHTPKPVVDTLVIDGTRSSQGISIPSDDSSIAISDTFKKAEITDPEITDYRVERERVLSKFLRRGRSASMTQIDAHGLSQGSSINLSLPQSVINALMPSSQTSSDDSFECIGERFFGEETSSLTNLTEGSLAELASPFSDISNTERICLLLSRDLATNTILFTLDPRTSGRGSSEQFSPLDLDPYEPMLNSQPSVDLANMDEHDQQILDGPKKDSKLEESENQSNSENESNILQPEDTQGCLDPQDSWLLTKRGTTSRHLPNHYELPAAIRTIFLNKWNPKIFEIGTLTQIVLTSRLKTKSSVFEAILKDEKLCQRLVYLEVGQIVDGIPPKVLDVGDSLICKLVKKCPGLVGIALHGAPELTDRSLTTILDWCKFVSGVLITGHHAFPGNISHKGMTVLKASRVACNLRELVLVNQPNIALNSAQHILDEDAPNLVLTTGTTRCRIIQTAHINDHHDGLKQKFVKGDPRRWMLLTDFMTKQELEVLHRKEEEMKLRGRSRYDVPRIFRNEDCMGGFQFPLDEEQANALDKMDKW